MQFTCKRLGLSSDNRVLIMDDDDAFKINAKPGDRIKLIHIRSNGEMEKDGVVAIINLATGSGLVKKGEVGLYDELWEKLSLSSKSKTVDVQLLPKPKSFEAIKRKVKGKELSTDEIYEIINDCTAGALLPIEIAAFIIGLETQDATDREIVDLAKAMSNSGDLLDLGEDVFDKHSTGGVPGNKVTLVIVPIVAAAGLLIPKTSTRAITSPSGTADTMEVLADVTFPTERVLKILKEINAGIFWGGSLNLAPADDALIQIEKPLNSDPFPLMIASIISKKICMGVKKMVLDIPCGKGTKFPTIDDGRKFAIRFKDIAQRIGIEAICLLTSASQPIGHAVGPAIEAREALYLLQNPKKGSTSLRNKSTELAGVLLEMGGKASPGLGNEQALEILNSGKALKKMREIIGAQGGNPDINWEDIEIGPHMAEMKTTQSGFITEIENYHINRIAKIAGCPAAKKSGVEVIFKQGSRVKEGDVIFRIYSDSEERLKQAIKYYNTHPPQRFSGMTIEKI